MNVDASKSDKFGFSFGVCDDNHPFYSIHFDISNCKVSNTPIISLYKENRVAHGTSRILLNTTPLIVPSDKIFNVKIIIEKSILAVYLNDNVAFTNRIININQNPWAIYAEDGLIKITGLEIKKYN